MVACNFCGGFFVCVVKLMFSLNVIINEENIVFSLLWQVDK